MMIFTAAMKNKIIKILSVLIAVLVWQTAAVCVNSDILLASPMKVVARLFSIWREPGFSSTVLFSFGRITAGFALAFVLGTVLGIAAGYFRLAEELLKPYVTVIKTVPAASFIIFCLIWLNYSHLTIVIAFFIAFPVIYSNVLYGIKNTDPKMTEFARLYSIPRRKHFLYISLPSVKSHLLSACSVSMGMVWKSGIAAEVIGIVDGSVGEMLYNAKVYFQNADLLCWTLIIIILSILSEKAFVFLLKSAFKGVEKL